MKTLKFFTLCSLVIALLAVPFVVLASAPSSPLFGTGFDSSFIVDHAGWAPVTGIWRLEGGTYYTASTPNWNGIKHNGVYDNFVYQATMIRQNCLHCLNELVVRASGPAVETAAWTNGYYFDYENDGGITVYREINGSFTTLVHTFFSNAVKRNGLNKLKVVANGSDFLFFVNNVLVVYGTDTAIKSGQVGIEFYGCGCSGKLLVDWARLTVGSNFAMPQSTSSVMKFDGTAVRNSADRVDRP